MTDKQQALRDLLAKVEAGDGLSWNDFRRAFGINPDDRHVRGHSAYNGSLDAALALHNAVLPEYILQFDTQGEALVYIPYRNGPATNPKNHTIEGKPARAALVCILKALIAKGKP